MDLTAADPVLIRDFLKQKNAPADYSLPPGLKTAALAGCVVSQLARQPRFHDLFQIRPPPSPGRSKRSLAFCALTARASPMPLLRVRRSLPASTRRPRPVGPTAAGPISWRRWATRPFFANTFSDPRIGAGLQRHAHVGDDPVEVARVVRHVNGQSGGVGRRRRHGAGAFPRVRLRVPVGEGKSGRRIVPGSRAGASIPDNKCG